MCTIRFRCSETNLILLLLLKTVDRNTFCCKNCGWKFKNCFEKIDQAQKFRSLSEIYFAPIVFAISISNKRKEEKTILSSLICWAVWPQHFFTLHHNSSSSILNYNKSLRGAAKDRGKKITAETLNNFIFLLFYLSSNRFST